MQSDFSFGPLVAKEREVTSIFQLKDEHEIGFARPEEEPGRRIRRRVAADFLSLVLGLEREPSSSSRAPGGKVGNRCLVFHFSRRCTPRRWKCENPAGSAGFSRGGGKRGKPGFGFPRFPRTRHLHGPPAPLSEWRKRRLHFALPQQPRLGGVHLACARGVAHRLRLAFQLCQA
jgi:hypothetical protein